MLQTVSKSQFKPQALEYLRMVEKTKKPLVITHAGRPVVRVEPYVSNEDEIPAELKKSVISYKLPTKPVGVVWEAMK